MILRRSFLAGAASLAAWPVIARADISRVTFSNSLEQGSLIIGKAPGASRVSVDGTNALVSPEGEFVFGFAYDQTKSATVALLYNDGTRETRVIAPAARQYELQAINGVPEKFVSPSPDQLARIKREGDSIVQARAPDTAQTFFDGGFDWPVAGIITSLFGSRRVLNGVPKSPHLGVDIAAGEGTPIRAPAPGIVSLAEPDYFYDGGITLIDHGHGVSTCYLHQSKLLVSAGDKIARGQTIGLVGQTGLATGPHLHWGLNLFQLKLDPSRSTPTPAPPRA